jgi:hypothetical protein
VTTIAWDGRTLAADRQATFSSLARQGRKLFHCGRYAYAACGHASEAELVAEWLRDGANPKERVRFDEEGLRGIAVRKDDGRVFTVQGKVVALVGHRFGNLAFGSGGDYALAAMALGRTAGQAVQFAARFDLYTGLGVDTWRRPKKTRR